MDKIEKIIEENRLRNVGKFDTNDMVDWSKIKKKEPSAEKKAAVEQSNLELNSGEDNFIIG